MQPLYFQQKSKAIEKAGDDRFRIDASVSSWDHRTAGHTSVPADPAQVIPSTMRTRTTTNTPGTSLAWTAINPKRSEK